MKESSCKDTAAACPAAACTNAGCSTAACTTAACPTTTGLAAFVSDWLSNTPKFSAQFAIHFGPSTSSTNKLGANAPSVDVTLCTSEKNNAVVPMIARPMKFRQGILATQIGELVSDVIVCGHRICSGNMCYEVKDEPVVGTHCDTAQDGPVPLDIPQEEILVVPMAPPAPPGQDIAAYGTNVQETEAASILRNSGLQNVRVPVPVSTIVDLLVAKTELSTRLEMAELLMSERQAASEQFQTLVERNSRLTTQLAVAEARQQFTDVLTASLMERTELAIKIAANDTKAGRSTEPTSQTSEAGINSVKAIQEDLSNIRRQIALLRRPQPIPFATSYMGVPRPYIPTAQLLAPLHDPEPVPVSESSAPEVECGTEEKAPAIATPAIVTPAIVTPAVASPK
ncbi:MAG: hypothetical protein ABL921_12245 [Pirellula sp.]